MGIDMTGYKMIYQDIVYKCLSIMPFWVDGKITELDVFYIDGDSRVAFIKDKASNFQFVSK